MKAWLIKIVLSLAACSAVTTGLHAAQETLYSTGFERSEGFDPQFTLRGQGTWQGFGSGGDGILENGIGFGQAAYVGFFEPTDANDVTSVWRPLNVVPLDHGYPVLKFSVDMQILESLNGHHDEFRWTAYALGDHRLFTLSFDTSDERIYLIDEDGQFVFTNTLFDQDGSYTLEITMNFGRNLWSATLRGGAEIVPLINSHPITKDPSQHLNLSDISAVWVVADPNAPGDNAMVFDNYRITAQVAAPPLVEAIRMHPNGEFEMRVLGEEGMWYEIQVTSDFVEWFTLGTYQAGVGGVISFVDSTSPAHKRGFYVASLASPP